MMKEESDIKEARVQGSFADGSFPSKGHPAINYITDDQGILMMIKPSLIIKGSDDDQPIIDNQGVLMIIRSSLMGSNSVL